MIELSIYEVIMKEVRQFCEEAGLASSTVTKKLGALDRLFRGISEIRAESINRWLTAYKSPRTGAPLGPHGMNNYIIEIRWYLRRTNIGWLHDRGKRILKKVKRREAKPGGRYIDATEFERVIQFAPSDAHELAFRLMRECAFRPHELLSIKVGDITKTEGAAEMSRGSGERGGRIDAILEDPQNRDRGGKEKLSGSNASPRPAIPSIIRLPDENPVTPSGKNKTGGRLVPVIRMSEELLVRAEKIGKGKGAGARLFPWEHRSLSMVYCRMKHQCTEIANIPRAETRNGKERKTHKHTNSLSDFQELGRLYDLRHTAITDMYRRGLPDQIIRQVVGWTPASKMPNVYVHIKEAHLHESYGRIRAQTKDTSPLQRSAKENKAIRRGWSL